MNVDIGMPHNQLGTLSGMCSYGLDAAYYYMRWWALTSKVFKMLILSYGEGIVVCFLFHVCVVISLFFYKYCKGPQFELSFFVFLVWHAMSHLKVQKVICKGCWKKMHCGWNNTATTRIMLKTPCQFIVLSIFIDWLQDSCCLLMFGSLIGSHWLRVIR